MPAANDRKIVLVTRKTRLEDLIARHLTAAQARFYVEHLGADFSDYEREHEVYQAQHRTTLQVLAVIGGVYLLFEGIQALLRLVYQPQHQVVRRAPTRRSGHRRPSYGSGGRAARTRKRTWRSPISTSTSRPRTASCRRSRA